MNGIQEVSGSIPLISTKKALKRKVSVPFSCFSDFFEGINFPKSDSVRNNLVLLHPIFTWYNRHVGGTIWAPARSLCSRPGVGSARVGLFIDQIVI